MLIQMSFSSHRLRNFKEGCLWYKDAYLLEYKMGNYVLLKHKIGLEKLLKCLFSLNFQANVNIDEHKRHVPNHNMFIILLI